MNDIFERREWRSSPRRRRRALSGLAAIVGVVVCCAAWTPYAAATIRGADDVAAGTQCGSTVTPAPRGSREIDLIIDDSGSMFSDGQQALDRWSYAKYSLEVMAAMLESNDTLNVYRTSDFVKGATPGPQVQLTGSESASERVEKIHAMDLQGGKTPYAPVESAVDDLGASEAQTRWLVILSDGAFNDRDPGLVAQDLQGLVAAKSTESRPLKVAFLGIGDEAPRLPNDPEHGIYFAHAATSIDLLHEMTGFSNRIFERILIKGGDQNQISPDIALSEALVFAQGGNVEIDSAQTTSGSIAPTSVVDVSWADNPNIHSGGGLVPAIPNKDLRGKLATYQNLPQGDITFGVTGAETVDVFYKPKVDFGAQLIDSNGQKVAADKIVGGEYTLNYGFMDENCDIISSDLLGEVTYTAQVIQNGKVVVENFTSGDSIDLKRGDVTLDVGATYLGGSTSKASIDVRVLQPATPVTMTATNKSYDVSKLDAYVSPDDAIELTVTAVEAGAGRPLSAEEWSRVTPEAIQVSSASNLDFDVALGDKLGQVFILPKAPGGDVYAADTGQIELQVQYSVTYDEQSSVKAAQVTTTIVDDLSSLDRMLNWFRTVGWKLLLLLIALILLIGYLTKKRFSKRMKAKPFVTGTPRQVGTTGEEGKGKFVVNSTRRLLPFVADTATLTYVPSGVGGFKPLKLKAGRRKTMVVTNWREIAPRNNVEINGTELNEETKRAPVFGPAATITCNTQKMTYEMTPSQ